MKKIILFGHTGSINRGSDAIVKSTADLFHEISDAVKVVLVTNRKSEDGMFGFEEYDKVIESANFEHKVISRCVSLFYAKVLGNQVKSSYIRFKCVEKEIDKNSIVLVVGGDVYCYGYNVPPQMAYIVDLCEKKGCPCCLWACSVEGDRIKMPKYKKHFEKYTLICAREEKTYNAFLSEGYAKEKIKLMSDPAFGLKAQKVQLPDVFSKPTIGINISDVALNWSNSPELLLDNIYELIDYLLGNTDINIALIPHVYEGKKENVITKKLYGGKIRQYDTNLLSKIKARYWESDRVFLVNKFYNSKQLKYIISQCYGLITARTHASIAGYSSGVPTIVIGYSVKAEGLAKSIFGTSDKWVVHNKNITNVKQILEASLYMLNDREKFKKREKEATSSLNVMNKQSVREVLSSLQKVNFE